MNTDSHRLPERKAPFPNRRATTIARLLALFVCVLLAIPQPAAQRLAPGSDGQSLPEVVEAIEKARVVTRILYVTAHPDDESFGALTYLARGLHADVALLSITRGEGGQNALGPEQGAALGMLRTEELLAATRTYGVRLYFTRAPDFGYSKSPEETLRVWGREAFDDVVQVIRTFRPHIVINHWGGARSGHGQHQAAGLLTPEAVASAANPEWIPLRVDRGLDNWRTGMLLQLVRGDAAGAYRLAADEISPLWGRSYTDMGRDGFLNHRTQGIAGFLAAPFLRRTVGLVRSDGGAVDGKQLAAPLVSLAARFPEQAEGLRPTLEECEKQLVAAERAAQQLDWPESVRALAKAAQLVSPIQRRLAFRASEAQLLTWELDRISERIDHALLLAAGATLEATADRNLVTAGGRFGVRVEWRHRAGFAIEAAKPQLQLPKGWTATEEPAEGSVTRFSVAVPLDAKSPEGVDAWMLPWPPRLVGALLRATVEGYPVFVTATASVRRATSTRVEAAPLSLVPAVSVALQPRRVFVRTGQPLRQMELLARVQYYGTEPARLRVGIEAPKGWRVSAEQTVEFAEAGDQLVRFVVAPPARILPGKYELKAFAKRADGEEFRTSLEPLATLPARMWSEPAVARVHVMDMAVPSGLRVGYIAAENDPIPWALQQLGVRVELLNEVELAFGGLSKYDAIAIGIRAYELRQDLARANKRLLDYAAAGGTLVVQYQREGVWNQMKPAPYPATIGGALRTTDENSPVRIPDPAHAVLNFPNAIRAEDFNGWVQERGLYYWDKFDVKYAPILALRDPGEQELLGGLVYVRHGKGVYIYTGLSFFRQLPEGVPGAYRLFVNLLSQGKATKAK